MNHQQQFAKAIQAYNYGRLDEAEKLLRELRNQFPKFAPYISALGVVLIAKGKPKEATRILEEGLKYDPRNIDIFINLSSAQKARGRLKEAYSSIQQALKLNPRRADIYYNKANILMDAKKYDPAEIAFKKAIKFDPKLLSAHFNLGNLYLAKGDLSSAKEAFNTAVSIQPDYLPALMNLGNMLADEGNLEEAETLYERAVNKYPKNTDALLILGKHYLDQGKGVKAFEILKKAADLDPSNADTFVLLGNAAKESGQTKEAENYYKKALELAPENDGAKQNLQRLLSYRIPKWHFNMLADDLRNDAYQKAIQKVVNEQSVVLDIGTGSGLLAMMAAKAGAKQVVTCELDEKLASVATQIIKDNGYSKSIRVINKKSTELSAKDDLSERANVLISEILDVGAIGEGVIPVIRHAFNKLLTEDAKIIPSAVKLYGQIMEVPDRSKMSPITEIAGFDLSAFNVFRAPDEYIGIQLKSEEHRVISEVTPLLDFNFYKLPPAIQDNSPRTQDIVFPVIASGEAQAVVFWFDLYLDDDIMVSSRSGGELAHWGQALFCFPKPEKVKTGDKKTVKMIYSDHLLRFAFE